MSSPDQARFLAPQVRENLHSPCWQERRRGTLVVYNATVRDPERTLLHQAKLFAREDAQAGTQEPLAFDYFYLDAQLAFGVQMRRRDFATARPASGLATAISQREQAVPGDVPAERHFFFNAQGHLQEIMADALYQHTQMIGAVLAEIGVPDVVQGLRRTERRRLGRMALRMGLLNPQYHLSAPATLERIVANITSPTPALPGEQIVWTPPEAGGHRPRR